ncbi:MAG: hypothetical protein HUU21_14625, partial [Polyangiaceae bacterium]|nr:hypothetical protein [Polyangiaceae bacterium]
KLNSCLYIGKGGQLPQVTVEELSTHAEGLICLSGGAEGPHAPASAANPSAATRPNCLSPIFMNVSTSCVP